MNSELKMFDSEIAIQQAGGDSGLADELFSMLVNELPSYHQKVDNQYEQGNYEQLIETVHKLNGATRYTGVPALSSAANQFEQALRGDKTEQYDELCSQLTNEIKRLKDAYLDK